MSYARSQEQCETMLKTTRSVRYIPDLQGLGDVCSETWEAWTTKENSANVVRVFHYLMFLEKTLRTAMLYIIHCMNLEFHDYTMWTDSWTLSLCQTLDGMTIPKFLAVFLDLVGTFAGPSGSDFFWSVPEGLLKEDADGFMGSKYMSSYPSFRVIRRLMRNMLDKRSIYVMPGRHTRLTMSNRVLWHEDKIRMLPGLRGAFAAIGNSVSERIANMQLDFEPQDNEYNSKFYFQQGDEDYVSYIDRVFDRCAEGGMPSTKLTLPRSSPKGAPVPLLVYHPALGPEDDILPMKYYATCARKINLLQSHRDIANLYRPTLMKERKQVIHEDEEADRYDLELRSSYMKVDDYSFRHFSRIYTLRSFI